MVFVAFLNSVCNDQYLSTNAIAEIKGLQSNLTLAEIKSKEAKLQSEVRLYRSVP